MPQATELIFVYNADAGIFSVASDFAHKILSPQTYTCNLCKLTYGAFNMKKQWKEFLEGLPQAKVFLHKDEFQRRFPQMSQVTLPAVLALVEGRPQELVTAEEINAQEDLIGLQNALRERLKTL